MYIKHKFDIENGKLYLTTNYGVNRNVLKCTKTEISLSELNLGGGNSGGDGGEDNYLIDVIYEENSDKVIFTMLNGNVFELNILNLLESLVSSDINNVLSLGSDGKLKVVPNVIVKDAFGNSIFNAFS